MPMRLSVLFTLAAVTLVPVGASQQPPPRFADRVDVSNVVVDVRVLDEFGAPISGLTAPDFFVTIGGKPAKVVSSIWTGAIAAPVAAQPSAATRAQLPVDEPGQLVVLLFQKSLTRERARGLIRMVGQSRDLVRNLPLSAKVAILTFESSLRMWSDFTSDHAALDRILEHGLLHERAPPTVAAGVPSLAGAIPPAARKVSTIEQAFEAIGSALAPLPGSKAVGFVGHGFGKTPFGMRMDGGPGRAAFGAHPEDLASSGDMNREYFRAWRTLTTARVSVFSLDTTNADTHSLAVGMKAIAESTGGFYASSIDFPEKPMHLFAGALSGHYVLFVEPPERSTGRTIEVALPAARRAYVYSTSSYRASEK